MSISYCGLAIPDTVYPCLAALGTYQSNGMIFALFTNIALCYLNSHIFFEEFPNLIIGMRYILFD